MKTRRMPQKTGLIITDEVTARNGACFVVSGDIVVCSNDVPYKNEGTHIMHVEIANTYIAVCHPNDSESHEKQG